jgi:undecaprenyl-diphosphatase
MTLIEAIILGIIQGLTEFIPISSSAHLVLVPYLLNWQIDPQINFAFDVLVQLGTLLAVLVYFRQDLIEVILGFTRALVARRPFETHAARLGWFLILATIPAGLAGLLVKDMVEAAFNSPQISAAFLFVTAALMVTSERVGRRNRGLDQINRLDAVVMGFMQALAIFPGISRSGATIAGGLFRSLDRRTAARFSFLMSIPIMFAAGLMAALDLVQIPGFASMLPVVGAGFVAAAIVGYLAIHWLLGFLQKHSLTAFAIYCTAAGSLVLLVSLLR